MGEKDLSGLLIELSKNRTLAEIANAIGVTDSYLSRLRAGYYKSPGLDVLINLSLYAKYPLEKLLKLVGQEQYYVKMKRCLAKEFRQEPALELNVPDGEYEGVKCYDSPVCLGPGYNMDEAQVVGYVPIHKGELPKGYKSEPDRIACFHTNGASMLPTILPHSHIVIDRYVPAEWVQPGGLYAFLLPSGDVTIKRLIRVMDEALVIDADNPDPKERQTGSTKDFPMFLQLREDCSVVRGRVIWVFNRLIEKPKE